MADVLIVNTTDDIIKELFESTLKRYQSGLEESMRSSEFVYDCVNELHKVDLNRRKTYINSPIWLKNKKATINPKNMKDDFCFQYPITVALNYGKIKNHPERIKNIKPFIDQYDWSGIYFPSYKTDWNLFEKNNKSVALDVLHVPHNTKRIRHAYKSKYNLSREDQVILLMITDGKKWHYLAVKSVSALLRGITGNNHDDICCLNSLHSYTTENKLKKYREICENHRYCKLEMPKEGDVIECKSGEKSIMIPFAIYADLESILKKISSCEDDPEKPPTAKINKHTTSGYLLFSHCLFDKTKNKCDYYRGVNCMRNFSLDLRYHTEKIISYEQGEIIPLTKEQRRAHRKQKLCYICDKKFSTDDDNKKYHKIKDHCYYTGKYRGAAHVMYSKKFKIQK